MITVEEAHKIAYEKYGTVIYTGENSVFYSFIKEGTDKDSAMDGNVWVTKYTGKACDNPDEWYAVKPQVS